MERLDPLRHLGLRTRLLILNAVVVMALAFLAVQAWRASASQDAAQAEQVGLSEALRLSISSGMHHDATRGNVLSALLMAQNGEPVESVQQAVLDESAATVDELRRLAAMALPAPLDTAVDQQLAQALIYADLAQTVSVLVRQSEVLRGVPYREFERMHAEILRSMAKLGNAVSATLDKRRKAAADAAEQSRWALMAVCAFTIAVTSLVVLLITQGIRARLRAMAGVAAAIAGGDLARRTQARGTDELAGLGLAIDQMARWPTA